MRQKFFRQHPQRRQQRPAPLKALKFPFIFVARQSNCLAAEKQLYHARQPFLGKETAVFFVFGTKSKRSIRNALPASEVPYQIYNYLLTDKKAITDSKNESMTASYLSRPQHFAAGILLIGSRCLCQKRKIGLIAPNAALTAGAALSIRNDHSTKCPFPHSSFSASRRRWSRMTSRISQSKALIA